MAWDCMTKKQRFVELFENFGNSLRLDQSTMVLLEEFICHLYGQKSKDINNTRHILFQKKVTKGKKAPDMALLPPCRSTFSLHVRRAVFVANMWRNTPTSWLDLPDITGFGWEVDGTPIWIDEAFPDDVAELLFDEEDDEEEDDFDDDSDDESSGSEDDDDEDEGDGNEDDEDDVFV